MFFYFIKYGEICDVKIEIFPSTVNGNFFNSTIDIFVDKDKCTAGGFLFKLIFT